MIIIISDVTRIAYERFQQNGTGFQSVQASSAHKA